MLQVINEFKGRWWDLSNFSPNRVYFEGQGYPTSEHAFQAAKSDSPGYRSKVAQAPSPAAAKKLGRDVQIRPYWDAYWRYESMRMILRIKFQSPGPRTTLHQTGDALLIEGNYWGDTTWGVDLNSDRGHNILGLMLMDLRHDIWGN